MESYTVLYLTYLWIAAMAYNFQKYSLDRIQYLGAPYDTGEPNDATNTGDHVQ